MTWRLTRQPISKPAMADWLSTKDHMKESIRKAVDELFAVEESSKKSAFPAYQFTALHRPIAPNTDLGQFFQSLDGTNERLTDDVFISTFNSASIASSGKSTSDLEGLLDALSKETFNDTFWETLPPITIPATYTQGETTSLPKPPRVVTVVIDTGLAFAHERFSLYTDAAPTTRVVAFVDMNRRSADSPDGYHILKKSQIDALLNKYRLNGRVDEHALYVEAGLIDQINRDQNPVARASSHGTQIMDAACGYDAAEPEERVLAEQHAIIAIELPQSVVADSHGHRHEAVLTTALHQAQTQIFKIFRESSIPVILNYSFGNYAGRHDGNGPIEDLLDKRIFSRLSESDDGGTPRIERCAKEISMAFLAAGNSLQQRTRARYAPGELKQLQTLDLIVQPDSKEHVFLQIWTEAPAEGADIEIRVGLTPPNGPRNPIGTIKAPELLPHENNGEPEQKQPFTSVQEWAPDGTTKLAGIYYQVDPISDDRKNAARKMVITVCIRPTASDDFNAVLAPSGVWKLDLSWLGALDSPSVDIWIERGDTPSGFTPRGRQAYFDHPDYPLFREDGRLPESDARNSSPIKREGTISAIATGKRTTVVSANRVSDGGVALYSSIGPMGDRVGPHLSAPGDFDWVNTGMLFAGNYSGSVMPIRGTSIAAPQVARRAAWMCINTDIKPEDIVSKLETEAAIDEAKRKDKVSPRFAASGRLKPKNQSQTDRKRRKLMADR